MSSFQRLGSLAVLGAALTWSPGVNAAKVACVGDSITYGYGLASPDSQSYPATLGFKLGADHTVQNFGVSGATLLKNGDKPYWNEASYGASGSFAPDVVVIMLGTNDAKPQNWSHESEFSSDYLELIAHYRSLGALVYVATPPPVYPPGAFDISPDVIADEVVPAVRAIATDAGAPLIDVFTALSGKAENFPDTVHPDLTGAFIIAETVRFALEETGFGGAGPGAGAGGVGQGGGASAGRGGTDAAGSAQGGVLGGRPSGGAGSPAGGEAPAAGSAAGGRGGTAGGGASGATTGSGGLSAAGGSGGAPSGGALASAGRASGAGTAGGSGAGPGVAAASGSGAEPASTSSDSGCGCRVAGSERLAHPAWSALALAAAWALGRSAARRRRRVSSRG